MRLNNYLKGDGYVKIMDIVTETTLQEELQNLYHFFHLNPETGFEEINTGKKISEYLKDLGFYVTEGVGKTGLVAILKGKKDSPAIAIRADMDALPITEMTDLPFKSKTEGLMHACGHDVHITCALGAAKILSTLKNSLEGSVVMVFQPAEELNQGAKEMVKDGLFERFPTDMIFGLHNHPEIPCGKVAIKEGPLMAAVDRIEISIKGKGGHGGLPHRDIDPIVATASAIMNLQTIVSRNIDPLGSAVVSLGTINGGTANNVIPDSIELTGTVRTFDPEIRNSMETRIRQIVENTATALGCTGKLNYIYQLPPVINPERPTEILRNSVEEVLSEDNIVDPVPSTGGEDFSIFQEKVPGCFFWLGSGNPEKGAVHPWHSPLFRIDEDCLVIGAATLAQTVINAIKELSIEKR